MTAKLPKKSDVKFVLAEDVRNETGGKVSLLGVYAGEQFFVAGPTPPPGAPNVAFVLPSLAFVFFVTGGDGKFSGRFKVVAPDGKTIASDTPIDNIEVRAGSPAILATAAKPFVGVAFGTFNTYLEIGTAKFKFPFTITKGPTPKTK